MANYQVYLGRRARLRELCFFTNLNLFDNSRQVGMHLCELQTLTFHRLPPVSFPLPERLLFGRLFPTGRGHSLTPQRSRGPLQSQTAQ